MASVGSAKTAEPITLNIYYTHIRSKQLQKHIVGDFYFTDVFITIS